MLTNLEQMRTEALKLAAKTTKKICRNGGDVKGHWRHYNDHSIWIEATEKVAYQAVITRRAK